MFFIGLGMALFGFLKYKLKEQRTKEDTIDEMRKRYNSRGQYDADIDMDEIRNNPQLRQQILNRGSRYHPQANNYAMGANPNNQNPAAGHNNTHVNHNPNNNHIQHNQQHHTRTQHNTNQTTHSPNHHAQHQGQGQHNAGHQNMQHQHSNIHPNQNQHNTRSYHNHTQQQPIKGQSGYCPNCRTPLLKNHKSCPMCGTRV